MIIKADSFSEDPLIPSWVFTFPLYDTGYRCTYTGIIMELFMGMRVNFTYP